MLQPLSTLTCSATKADHVAYWMNPADQNWQEVGTMFTAGTYVPCLFWAHLTIEKLAKALWVQDNTGDTPPFTHNIARLLGRIPRWYSRRSKPRLCSN